jgi:hypothetical protein
LLKDLQILLRIRGGVLSGPAKAAKQGLFELLKFTKIGLKIRPPQLELGSVPCEIGKLKQC